MRQRPSEFYVNRDGSVLYGRVDALYATWNYAIVRIDRGRLANLNIARLGLCNLERGFQLVGLHHLGQRDAGRHVLAHLVRQVNQDAGDAVRADVEEEPVLREEIDEVVDPDEPPQLQEDARVHAEPDR